MAVSGCSRVCLLALNLLFWLIGLFLVGFIAWTMATNPAIMTDFVSGTRYFTYSILSTGILITLAGFFGCVGGLKEGTCLLKTFIALTIIVLLVEIAGGLAAYLLTDQLHHYRDSGWNDFNLDTKDFLQKELKCCGFSGYTEYDTDTTKLPESCYQTPADTTSFHTEGCWSKIDTWLNTNIAIWAGTLGGVGFIEILCVILAAVMLCKINSAAKISHALDRDPWADRHDGRTYRDQVARGDHRRGGGGGGGRGYSRDRDGYHY